MKYTHIHYKKNKAMEKESQSNYNWTNNSSAKDQLVIANDAEDMPASILLIVWSRHIFIYMQNKEN